MSCSCQDLCMGMKDLAYPANPAPTTGCCIVIWSACLPATCRKALLRAAGAHGLKWIGKRLAPLRKSNCMTPGKTKRRTKNKTRRRHDGNLNEPCYPSWRSKNSTHIEDEPSSKTTPSTCLACHGVRLIGFNLIETSEGFAPCLNSIAPLWFSSCVPFHVCMGAPWSGATR